MYRPIAIAYYYNSDNRFNHIIMDIYLWFISFFLILCFSALFFWVYLINFTRPPKPKIKVHKFKAQAAQEKMKMQKETSVEAHFKIGGANQMSSTIKKEFLKETGNDQMGTESNQEKSDKVLLNEKENVSSSLSRRCVASQSIKLWSTNASNFKEIEKTTELLSKRFEEKLDNSLIDNGQSTGIVKSAKKVNNSQRKPTKASIFEKSPPRKMDRNLLPLFNEDTSNSAYHDVSTFGSLDEETVGKPEIIKKENTHSVIAEAKPHLAGARKRENTHEAQASIIKTTPSLKEENFGRTLVYGNGQCSKQDATMPMGLISKSQPGFGVPVANVNQSSVISSLIIPSCGASAVKGSHLKKNIRTKDLPSNMDTDEEDKENTNIVGSKDIRDKTCTVSLQYTSEMEDEDINLSAEAATAQNFQSMEVEGLKKYRRKNKTVDEENMISDSETEPDNDGMMVEVDKHESYIHEDCEMADISHQKTTAVYNKLLSGLPLVKSAKSALVSKMTIKPKTMQTVFPKTNHSTVSNQPLANDSSQCFRKTLSRVQLGNNQKVFVVKEIPVMTLPTSKQANQTVVKVKFRRSLLPAAIQDEMVPKDDTLPRTRSSHDMLQTTEDCALKREAKRIISIERSIGFEEDLDSTLKKTKKVTEEPPMRENHVLLKRKVRWTRSKAMMKKGNSQTESGQSKVVESSTDMDFNNIEVSGIDCDICFRRFLYMECTWCPNSDKICLTCIREVIKDTLDNKKVCLECPRENCRVTINLDLLSKKVDSVTVEILERKLLKRLEKVQAETYESLYDTISCPVCQGQITLNIDRVHAFCPQCKKELCSYCQQSWISVRHNECSLLNYSGQKCFTTYHELPANWVRQEPKTEGNQTIVDVEASSDVDLNSGEGKAVIQLFTESMTCKVSSIRRVQTIKLWEKYALKRRHMVDELGLSGIKERALFHGTESACVSLICQEGFDMRVKTVNGALWGKGVYFSTNSQYSHSYTKGSHTMFIARVLCGNSTLGNREILRPPKDASGRLYDTCVNDKQNIYVVFDNAQCFPAYVITYVK